MNSGLVVHGKLVPYLSSEER